MLESEWLVSEFSEELDMLRSSPAAEELKLVVETVTNEERVRFTTGVAKF